MHALVNARSRQRRLLGMRDLDLDLRSSTRSCISGRLGGLLVVVSVTIVHDTRCSTVAADATPALWLGRPRRASHATNARAGRAHRPHQHSCRGMDALLRVFPQARHRHAGQSCAALATWTGGPLGERARGALRAVHAAPDTPLRPSIPPCCRQAMTELAAQRRAAPPASGALQQTVSCADTSKCFAAIADAIKRLDKPYVSIEDGADGSAVRSQARSSPGPFLHHCSQQPPRSGGAARPSSLPGLAGRPVSRHACARWKHSC